MLLCVCPSLFGSTRAFNFVIPIFLLWFLWSKNVPPPVLYTSLCYALPPSVQRPPAGLLTDRQPAPPTLASSTFFFYDLASVRLPVSTNRRGSKFSRRFYSVQYNQLQTCAKYPLREDEGRTMATIASAAAAAAAALLRLQLLQSSA